MNSAAYLRFFCAADTSDMDALKDNEPQRVALYRMTASLLLDINPGTGSSNPGTGTLSDGTRPPLYPAILALFAEREWAYFTTAKWVTLGMSALAIGATQWQTIRRVVLPAARSLARR